MSTLPGATALVTGGASGIGRIMARLLLERGARVVIWDIDDAARETTVAELSRQGTITGTRVDLADAAQIARAAAALEATTPIDLLVNNAGIIVGKPLHEHTPADTLRTMAINATAPMLLTQALLPGMLARDRGHICNVASSAGLVANPRMTVYAGSKWAVVGWSDSLRVELARAGSRVKVTTVMPYYISTGMFDGVESRLPILEPEAAAKSIIRAIERDRRLVTLPGYIYRLSRVAQGLLPIGAYDWVAGNLFGIYSTMDRWRGRG